MNVENVKIFIASSSELEEERKRIHEIFDRLNKSHKHLNIEPVKWETDLEKGSSKKKTFQEDIDVDLESCQVVLVLLHSKLGRFTHNEYKLALEKGKKIYIYFKPFTAKTSNEGTTYQAVLAFIDELKKEGRTSLQDYDNIDKFNSIVYEDLNDYFFKQYPKNNEDSVLEKKSTEYDHYLADLERSIVNKKVSTSQPIFDKALPDLEEKQLVDFFLLERVLEAFEDAQYTGIEEKLTRLHLIGLNHYLIKGTFLCLGKSIHIPYVCVDATHCKFFVYDDVKGLRPEINQWVDGNLIQQYHAVIRHLKRNLYLIRDIFSDKPEDYDIPEIVFRELLANAIIHREYSKEKDIASFIQVELYPDRLEIKNPGNFDDAIDIKALDKIEKSYIKNLEISLIFFLYKFVESAGKGIKRIQEILNENRMKPAEFSQDKRGNYVKVTVYRKKPSSGLTVPVQSLLADKKNVTTLLSPLPARVVELIGRTEELQSIAESLTHYRRILLVNGLAGIGKTEVCKRFFFEHYQEYRYAAWIDWVGSISDSLVYTLSSDNSIMMGIAPQDTLDIRFNKILKFLYGLTDSFLMVLDNIEYSDNDELEKILALPPNIKILANSRGSIEGAENIFLNFLSLDSCKEIFYRFAGGKNEEEYVEKIIELCGRHTLTIELLAKTAHSAALTPKKLFELLSQKGFNLNKNIHERINTFWHSEKEKRRFFDHLIKIFDLSNVSDKEYFILANLSVLPSIYIDIENICEWMELTTKDSINELVDKGWLQRHENRIFIHPVLQEVIRFKAKPSAEICKSLIVSISNLLYLEPGENPILKKDFLKFGETILENIDETDTSIAILSNNLSSRYMDLGQSERALEFLLRANKIYEAVLDRHHPNLATSYNNLSQIYQYLGQINRALEFQLKALEIREALLDKHHPDLATSYNNLSLIYQDMGELGRALEFQLKATEIFEAVLDKHHPNLATSYNNLSTIYFSLGQLDRALEYQLKSMEMGEAVLDSNHPSLATSYNNLSAIFLEMKDYTSAFQYAQKAIAIMEKTFPNGHPKLNLTKQNLESIEKAQEK